MPPFAGAVRRQASLGHEAVRRPGVDDRAAAALLHRRDRVLGAEERAAQVDRHRAFELLLGGLEVAHRHVLYKLAMRDMGVAAGMTATFMAKPRTEQPGSPCHVHVSLRDDTDRPLFPAGPSDPADDGISGMMRCAIGGMLAHAPDAMAWYAPTVNSYRRAVTEDVAGWGATWGMDNRTTSVRVVGSHPEDLRAEFRLPGADTNPYLTLAVLLASVQAGVDNSIGPGAPIVGQCVHARGIRRRCHRSLCFRAAAPQFRVVGCCLDDRERHKTCPHMTRQVSQSDSSPCSASSGNVTGCSRPDRRTPRQGSRRSRYRQPAMRSSSQARAAPRTHRWATES